MKPINLNEVAGLRYAKQNFCDCYLVAAISALTRSKNGTEILRQNIQREGRNYCIKFNDVNGHSERYLVKEAEMDSLILMNRFMEPIEPKIPHHPIIKALEVAMGKLLLAHPDKKPFICKIPHCQENFEYNKVSNFFKLFTGVRPITINESGLRMSLKHDKLVAKNLFEKLNGEDNFSFVLGSGYKGFFNDLPHCWSVKRVVNSKIDLYDSRRQISSTYNPDNAIKRFKFICGYFNDMLKL